MSNHKEIVLIKTAILAMVATITGWGIPGLKPIRVSDDLYLYATWELSWCVEASLMISARYPDDDGTYEIQIRLNAPACERTISAALVHADLNMKVAMLAAAIDTQWGGKRLHLKAPVEKASS